GKEEKVLEKDDWEHSAFTKNLLSGLRDKRADYNEDGFITGSEIGMYVQENVTIETENHQTPQIRKFTTDEGEIIFTTKKSSGKSNSRSMNESLSVEEQLNALLLMLDQQNQSSINENQRVIKPGSIGLNAKNIEQEILIEEIFLRPKGLAYKAKRKIQIGMSDSLSWGRMFIIEIGDVLEIPGQTSMGIYNYDTGSVD
ncbi:MAG: hypothetical protein QF864_15625, partial [SAR202 cluster bacterium]|nr:hypothetical protein [SAR202 cluster bacterium]